jgi:hypothetical protein
VQAWDCALQLGSGQFYSLALDSLLGFRRIQDGT